MSEALRGFLLPVISTSTGIIGLTIDQIHTGLSIGVIIFLGIPAGVLAILVHLKNLRGK